MNAQSTIAQAQRKQFLHVEVGDLEAVEADLLVVVEVACVCVNYTTH
jgi:hypothetical protein